MTETHVPATATRMGIRRARIATRRFMVSTAILAAVAIGPAWSAGVNSIEQQSALKPDPTERPGRSTSKAVARKPPKSGDGKDSATKASAVALKGKVPPVVIAPEPPRPPPPKPTVSPEPQSKLPRFVALKTDDTNMRKGPGQRYPIEWVYKRRDLPVEVEREYDVWRYVRDPDGVEGWMHQVTLSDRRTFITTNGDAVLRRDANDTASEVAILKLGVIGRLRECDEGSKWCQVQVSGFKGYLRRDQIWGLLPDEVLTP